MPSRRPRRFAFVVFVTCLIASVAGVWTRAAQRGAAPSKQTAAPQASLAGATEPMIGIYNGTYSCSKEPTRMRLSLDQDVDGSLKGVFTFFRCMLIG